MDRHLDVGSSNAGAVVGPKGWAVRPLKLYASWVQNVVRQFGPYPIDGGVWHLDVGSSHPGAVAGPKGMAVRHLKRYVSWV